VCRRTGKGLNLADVSLGATIEQELAMAQLLEAERPAVAAELYWDVAVSDLNDAIRVKGLHGLAGCRDGDRLTEFAAATTNDPWLRHRAGLGLLDLDLGPEARVALRDLLAIDASSLGEALFQQPVP
jgi:hypothetical protein